MALTVFTKRRKTEAEDKDEIPLGGINQAIREARDRLSRAGYDGLPEGREGERRALHAAAALLEAILPPLESAHRILERLPLPAGAGMSVPARDVREKIHASMVALGEAKRMCRTRLEPEGPTGKEEPETGPRALLEARPAEGGVSPVRPEDRPRAESRAARVRRTLDEVVYHTGLLQLNARVEGEQKQDVEASQ